MCSMAGDDKKSTKKQKPIWLGQREEEGSLKFESFDYVS